MTVKDWLINLGSEASLRLLAVALILIVGIIVIQIILAILGKALKKTKMEKAAHTLIRSVTRILL